MPFVRSVRRGTMRRPIGRWASVFSTMWRSPRDMCRNVTACSEFLIVDWDVHHGNGTQHSFERDPSVLFFSTHQYPHYPGTGRATERGSGAAEGLTINVPMEAGEGDDEYRAVFQKVLVPAADAFKPDFVIISAGFDAHRDDPLASMGLTEEGYGDLTANRGWHCQATLPGAPAVFA